MAWLFRNLSEVISEVRVRGGVNVTSDLTDQSIAINTFAKLFGRKPLNELYVTEHIYFPNDLRSFHIF